MKHYIIVKFKDKTVAEKIKVPVKALFERTLAIEGINAVEVKTCCIDRENRYDMMITIDMEKEALSSYDVSEPHKEWKAEYGDLIEKKAIFDSED